MQRQDSSSRSPAAGARPRRGALLRVREWWWDRDRARRVAELRGHERLHCLDESYVVDAMARQIEEIRNLPQPGGAGSLEAMARQLDQIRRLPELES